jgi:hypothetical protein
VVSTNHRLAAEAVAQADEVAKGGLLVDAGNL